MQPVAIRVAWFSPALKPENGAMPPLSLSERAKRSLVLVHEPTMMRGFMEQSLKTQFDLRIFANTESALEYIRSAESVDVLVSQLDFGGSPIGGCNIARELKQRFPDSFVFMFLGEHSDDHRLDILSSLTRVTLLDKPFGALFLSR